MRGNSLTLVAPICVRPRGILEIHLCAEAVGGAGVPDGVVEFVVAEVGEVEPKRSVEAAAGRRGAILAGLDFADGGLVGG